MSPENKYCIIDAGNTSLKVVDFLEGKIDAQVSLAWKNKNQIKELLYKKRDLTSILSSVVSPKIEKWIIQLAQPNYFLGAVTKLPISLENYKTPNTLGADRIANAVAAQHFSKTKNALVVDIGTCIKFDLIKDKHYCGGSISPGYEMRFKALNQFTGALPLVHSRNRNPLIGQSTEESILSGIHNGIQSEIEGFIAKYSTQINSLTIFLTGGDHKKFDMELKNSIFADENLTLKGLYLILKHNV